MKRYSFLLILLITNIIAFAQAPGAPVVNINTGNPRFPFPQFLEYSFDGGHSLDNLGTENAPGVVHAELEQDIRDAWQIFANEFTYTGETYNGIRYIKGNNGCPYDCSEGDGYALLAAAYMADKDIFDGLWLRTHDVRRISHPRYSDCVVPNPNYRYGKNALMDNADAASDGDFDIALALLMAYMQWGEFMGINDACGNPISYRKEALEVIQGLVEITHSNLGDCRSTSGDIGFDGYVKNGNTWLETTGFSTNRTPECPEFAGPTNMHVDYMAPGYFRAFHKFLTDMGVTGWNVDQFQRAEASSDWIVGEWIYKNPRNIPVGGWVDVTSGSPVWTTFMQGEDFRAPWRTILNYVWHGNPDFTWNPTTHQVMPNTPNSYEYDAAVRYTQYLKAPQGSPWNNNCVAFGGGPSITYKGPPTLQWEVSPTGAGNSAFTLNWIPGTGTAAVVAAQDMELLGQLYRQCVIEWDIRANGDGYLTSIPVYFHGWFRLLGMLVATGNAHTPTNMVPKPNLKIYRAIENGVTFAFTGDQLTYNLSYRNYGSVSATNSVIVEQVPEDFTFISATHGGVYNSTNHTVTWDIGTVPGFQTGQLAQTKGAVSYKVKIKDNASGRYCTSAEISCSNGFGSITNDYPNNITATMERNCVDVIKRALKIEKSANRDKANKGNLVTYTIEFENSADAGWIDGGRPGVNVAYAHDGISSPTSANQHALKIRLFHDAVEPYINYGNYRISYFMHDPSINCYAGVAGCGTGWELGNPHFYEGGDASGVEVLHENIVAGSDARGEWNQRLVIQFAPLLVTTTPHLSNYFGMTGMRIHRGGGEPLRAKWVIKTNTWTDVNWANDWSWDAAANDSDDGRYHPVTPDWTDIYKPGLAVTTWHRQACESATKTVENILVEEWDGYVWRRILGNGPVPGRDIANVIIRDTLPPGVTFDSFVPPYPFGIAPTISNGIITWTIPKLQVNQSGKIVYNATVNFPSGANCATNDEKIINKAWIEGTNESAVGDIAEVTVTCANLPTVVEPTTMIKTADKTVYSVGDNITYTLVYTQTHGTISTPPLTSTTDWTGSGWSATGGRLTSASNNSGKITYDYAYGKNGFIEATVQQQEYSTYRVVLREGAATPIAISIKKKWGSQLVVSYIQGSTVIESQTLTYGGTVAPYTLKVHVYDGLLRLWINSDTTQSPIYSRTNVPQGTGFAGFANGNASGGESDGAHQISNIRFHFDAGFDLVITDPIPSEITFGSAQNSGVNSGGTVTWNIPSGKGNGVPFGTKTTVKWSGTVNACNTLLENVAYANLRGHVTNSIAAQSVVDCGVSACPDPPSVTSPIRYCQNATNVTTLSAVGENLKWYTTETSSSGSTEAPTPSTSDVTTLNYWVTQTVSGCESGRAQIQVIIDPLPTVSINPNSAETCSGTSLSITAEATGGTTPYTTHAWTGTDANYLDNTNTPSTSFTTNVTTTQTYTLTYEVTDSRGCKASANKDIKVHALPTVTLSAQPTEICKGTTSTITATVSPTATGGVGTWTGATKVTETTATFSGATTSNVSYSFTSAENCTTENASSISITVHSAPDAPEVEDVHYCQNAIPTPLTAIGDNLLWYTEAIDGTGSPTAITPNTSSVATLHYWVSQTVNDCESERSQITVTIHALPTAILTTTPSEICSGNSSIISAAITPSATGGVGTWTGATKNTETTATFSGTSTTIISYSFKDAHGCTMASPTTTSVTVHSMPAAPTVVDLQYCKDATLVPALTAVGSNLTWYTAAEGGSSSSIAPTPSTNEVGKQEHWVSQTVNGCESERAKITVTILDELKPIITATPGFSLCENETTTLGISGGVFSTRTWSGTASAYLNSTSVATPTFSDADAGIYTIELLVTDASGCEGTVSETIEVHAVPSTSLSALEQVFCVDVDAAEIITAKILPETVQGTGTWTGVGLESQGNTTVGFNPSVAKATASPHTITYNFISDANCAAEPSTIQMTVHALPNVSISPSRVDACESGNNSEIITITPTGTASTGKLTYSSTTATIDLSSGELDPTANSVGKHTIRLDYEDANGCTAFNTTEVEVHKLPDVKFGVNPTTMCIYDAAHTILVSPTAPPGTGIFTGAVTTAAFNPATQGVGVKNFTYTYRDTYGCENNASSSIEVIEIAPPTVTSGNPKTIVVQIDDTFLPEDNTNVSATGTYTVEWMDAACNMVEGTGETYITERTPLDLGTHTYKVRQTDALSGCSSECVDAILALSKCPASTPSANDVYNCIGESLTPEVTAIANGTQKPGDKLVWFSTNNTASTPIAGFDGVDTYIAQALTTAAVGTETVYVAQYNDANTCYSTAMEVTLHVVSNPDVTITPPLNVCAVDGVVSIPVTPNTGTLTGDDGGLDAEGRSWNPMTSGTPDPSKTIALEYKVSATQPDGKICSTTETANITAHFMAPPVATPKNWLINDIKNIPVNFMTAAVSGTGTEVNWYGDKDMTINLGTNSLALDPDRDALQSEVEAAEYPNLKEYVKSYWITQVNAQGCESEPVEITLKLVDCPFLAPIVVGEEACQNELLSSISAQVPSTTTEPVDEWKWYETDEKTPISNNSATYAHGVDNTVAATTTYYVSYKATEPVSGNQCESPKTEVKVIVNQLPDVSITVPAIVCQTDGDVVIPKTEKSYNGNGSGVWSIVGESTGISASGVFNSKFKGETTGIYTVDYTYTDAKGCVNNDQGNVLVQFTEPPTTEDHTSMIELNEPVVIKANTLPDATVNWYKEETAGVSLSTQNPWTTDDNPRVEVEKSYWASQTLHGCESKRTQAFVSITDCPVPAPIIASNLVQACLLEPMPILEASGSETIRWYVADDLIQYVHEGDSYQPTISTTGLHEFYISQYDGTCEGPHVKITVQVLETPRPGIIGNKTICDYEELTLTALTSTGTVYWYDSDPKTTTAVGTGNTYTISNYTAGVHSIWAVHENTCFSEPVEISITVNEQPTAPTLSGDNVCERETIVLQADGNTIQWYEDGNTASIGTGNSINISSKSVGNYKFGATQTVLGCTSDKNFIDVTVHDIPAPPVVNSNEICSNEEMVSFTAQGLPIGEINWYSDENCTIPVATTVNTYTPTTNVTQTVYVTQTVHNCTSQATPATITVHEQPKLVKFQHANNIEICEKSEQALIVTENNNIKWYDSETSTTPIQIGRFLNKTYTEVGAFTYYATQTVNNCESEKNSITVTVFPGPQPPSIVTNNLTLCEKTETGILEVSKNSPNETIVWTNESGESIALGTTLQVPTENSPIGFTRVYAHTAVSGCSEPSDKTPLTYQIVSQPNAPNVKQSQFCFTGTSITLEVEKGVNVSWYDANQTKISQCEYQNTCTPEIHAQGSYMFYVNQTVNNCESPMKEVQINIHPIPNPVILGATELCEKTTKTYAIQHASTDNTYEWDITGGHLSYEIAQAGITGHSRSFDFNKSGLDTITVHETNSYNCTGTAELPIVIAPIPQVSFTTENPGQEGLIRITNESKPQIVEKGETRVEIPVNYYWDFGTTYTDTMFIQNDKTIDVQYKYGNYVINLEAIDDFGCRNTYSEDIFVAISYRLFIPNAFSPGNPAKGVRTFKPIGYNLESFKMWVFDQWGNIIWYSEGVTDNGNPIGEWDGKYNGISLPSGAYIWKIEAVFADGTMWYDKKNNGKHTQFGTVNIVK